MKFIDLFSGLGGFHVGLAKLGHTCVYACEIDKKLRKIYYNNFGINPHDDITKIDIDKIPKHQILCAGFPCQPFSKAGTQTGFNHRVAGNMFLYLHKVIQKHKPKYLLLENVANLEKHNDGKTWLLMKKKLEKLGYKINAKIVNPTDFNIPQNRQRFFILGIFNSSESINFPLVQKRNKHKTFASKIIKKPKNFRKVTKERLNTINIWKNLLKTIPKNIIIPLPLWTNEFGATYPYKSTTPYKSNKEDLENKKGTYGRKLNFKTKKDIFNNLPSYARQEVDKFPSWKINFIKKNRTFYKENKKWLKEWIPILKPLFPSAQKVEWHCLGKKYTLNKKMIQFRPSGVRISTLENSPALIYSTLTQLPILPSRKRYLSLEECLKLQGLQNLKFINNYDYMYQALGNAVNADVVKILAKNLFK